MWVYPAVCALTCETTTPCIMFAQKQAFGGSLFYLWFSLLFMCCPGFHSSRQPGKQTSKLSSQIKQGFFTLRVPALSWKPTCMCKLFLTHKVSIISLYCTLLGTWSGIVQAWSSSKKRSRVYLHSYCAIQIYFINIINISYKLTVSREKDLLLLLGCIRLLEEGAWSPAMLVIDGHKPPAWVGWNRSKGSFTIENIIDSSVKL